MDDKLIGFIRDVLAMTDEEVGPACSYVEVPPTIVMDDDFRRVYSQGYRHALSDVRSYLSSEKVNESSKGEV